MICSARITVSEFFERTMLPARYSRKSPAHLQQMRATLRQLDKSHGRAVHLDELSDETIDRFKAFRSAVSPGTVNKDLRYLRSLARFALRRKFLSDQLDIEFEEELEEDPVAWWPEELPRIFEAASKLDGRIPGTQIWQRDFWQALPATIYSTGARISAIMQAPLARLDVDRGILILTAGTQKQRKGQSPLLHAETVEALKRILYPRELLFPWPYDKGTRSWPALINHYRKVLKLADLPTDTDHLFHCLRRTNATWLAAASDEATAQKQLGHSSPVVTRRYIMLSQMPAPSAKSLIAPPPIVATPGEPVNSRDPAGQMLLF